jgi:hypothetical protein
MPRFTRFLCSVPLVAFIAGCAPATTPDGGSEPAGEAFEIPVVGSRAEQPQLLATENGDVLLSWTARGDEGIDVYLARTGEAGESLSATRLNTVPGSVNRITIDEMRPAMAAGPGNRVAVAWTDSDYDIQLALSDDGGSSFGEPIRLNQDAGDAMQEFPSLAYDDTGVLHAVWLDPRFAEDIVEEPADLYYARIEDGTVTEQNLTAEQASTVCGCCLPDLQIDGNDILITFRNTTDEGYRDPFQISGTVSGEFGLPTEVTAPVWQIDACPVAGPIGIDDNVLWLDGSMGIRRLLESQGAGNEPRVILEDTGEWFLDVPPRRISGDGGEGLLLLPSVPAYVLRRDGEEWGVVIDDLPGWATSAAVDDGELTIVGSSDGRFVQLRRELPAN